MQRMLPTSAQMKVKNLLNGKVIEKTFRSGEKCPEPDIQENRMQYLYADGDDYVFMNTSTYDQMNVERTALGDAADYLIEQMIAQVAMYQGEIIGVEIAASVELTVTITEPGLQGDRSSGGTKPATLETGKEVKVPLFVNIGDRIKVDTRTGEYMARA